MLDLLGVVNQLHWNLVWLEVKGDSMPSTSRNIDSRKTNLLLQPLNLLLRERRSRNL
jgi:hypothetical protein